MQASGAAGRHPRAFAVDLDTLLELIPDGALLADREGTVVAVNPRLPAIFGYTADAIIGLPLETLVPESARDAHVDHRGLYLADPEPRSMAPGRRVAGRRHDGTAVDIEVSVSVLPGGELALAIVRDISDRARTEAELEAWGHVFEHAGFGVVIGDSSGRHLARVNPAFAEMHGYSVGELTGRELIEVFAPEVRPDVAADISKVHDKGRHVFESLHVRKDGTVFPVRIDATAVKDANGAVLYRVALVEDLTERRHAEAALVAASDDLRRHAAALERVNAALRRESAIAENMAEGVTLVRASDRVFVYVNPRFEAMSGYDPGELLGQPVSTVIGGGNKAPDAVAGEVISTLQREGSWQGELRNVRKDGSSLWCQVNISALEDPEYGAVWLGVVTDITQRTLAESALRASEERFRRVFEEAPLGMAVVGADSRLLQVNEALCDMLAYDAADLLGRRLSDLDAGVDDGSNADLLARVFSEQLDAYHIDHRFTTRRGQRVWAQVRASLVPGSGTAPPYAIVMLEDITARKLAEARLAHLAMHDELTGLPNRSLAMDRLRHMQTSSDRTRHYLAVLFVDLDGFKAVNDALGHEAGDAILVRVANRLQRALRPSDTAARLGGDEFIACCEDLGPDLVAARIEVHAIADRILEVLSEPIHLATGHVRISGSIGIVVTRGSEADAASLLRDADAAMYRAKARGAGQSEMYSREPEGERSLMHGRLNRAVEHNELDVHYQPVIDLRDGHVAGAEALVRWRHPSRGLLLPEEFLNTAERSGLIIPIGTWVLERVLTEITRWREQGVAPPFVAVNVSALQLDEPGFGDQVARMLESHGVEPRALHLEIAEGRFIEAAEPVLESLEGLRDLGVHLGLDDFGTGWSSLTHLQRFPVDFLKVDRSFVSDLLTSPSSEAIVTALITIGEALGLAVIPEGIENEGQADRLIALGCLFAQGWLYGRPQPADEFARFLARAEGSQSGVTR